MEWLADRDSLIQAFRRIQGAGGDVLGSHPIFGYMRLRAMNEELEFVSSNSIVTATTVTDARISIPGEVCVPLKQFRDAVDLLPSGEVRMQLGATNRLTMAGGGRVLTVCGRPGGEYPLVPEPPDEHVSIPAGVLRFLLIRTAHAASKKPDNPEPASVHITWKKPHLTAFAMDGHRAAEAKMKCVVYGLKKIVVHQLASTEILRLLEDDPLEHVDVSETRNHTFIRAGRTLVAIGKLEGRAPERPEEMLSNRARVVRVLRRALLEALRASRKMTQESTVWLTLGTDGITISSDPRVQEVSVEVYVPGEVRGAPFKICANGEHLVDGLDALDVENVSIGFGDTPLDAVSLRPDAEEDVVMIFSPKSECA